MIIGVVAVLDPLCDIAKEAMHLIWIDWHRLRAGRRGETIDRIGLAAARMLKPFGRVFPFSLRWQPALAPKVFRKPMRVVRRVGAGNEGHRLAFVWR